MDHRVVDFMFDRSKFIRNARTWLLFLVSFTTACSYQLDTVIPTSHIRLTENTVIADNGRFFMTGSARSSQSLIFEVVKDGQQNFHATPFLTGTIDYFVNDHHRTLPCNYGSIIAQGNILYASCVYNGKKPNKYPQGRSTKFLHRINLDLDPSHSEFLLKAELPAIFKPFLANGIAFDRHGSLYISNSASLLTSDPAIIKIDIHVGNGMSLTTIDWLAPSSILKFFGEGGIFPNGIQIRPSFKHPEIDTLYYSRGISLVKMDITPTGHDKVKIVYRSPVYNFIDGFSIYGDKIAMTEFNTFELFSQTPGTVTLISILPEHEGIVLASEKLNFIPSGITYAKNSIFGENAFLLGSFYQGGLRRITVSKFTMAYLEIY